MQVPALKDGGTELGWRLTFLFVILKQPCGAKREYLSRNAQRSLKSSSEQLEYWQLHAQVLPICGDRLEEVLTSSRMNVGHSQKSRWWAWASPLALAAALTQ
jgi:hypothetical protein